MSLIDDAAEGRTTDTSSCKPEKGPLMRGAIVPGLALAALVAGRVLPVNGWGFPVCWFKQSTGFPCLSCGLTRSFLHALHGDWAGALFLHPLGPLLVGVCAAIVLAPLVPDALRRRWRFPPVRRPQRILGILAALVAVLVANGLYRVWWIVWLGRPSPW